MMVQIPSMIEQLELAAVEKPTKVPCFNPKPAGVLRPGGAPAVVLEFMQSVTGFRSHGQIVIGVNRMRHGRGEKPFSGKAVTWALIFLRKLQKVEAVGDPARNERYLRYRAKRGSDHG